MGFYPAVATVGNVPTPLPVADGGTGVTWGSPITQLSGMLGADVSISAESTVLTVPSLAVGTWLIMVNINVEQETASAQTVFSCRANGGTATYSVAGGNSSAQQTTTSIATATHESTTLSLTFIATVTVAGTVIITAFGDSGTPFAKASTPEQGYPNATGYVAVRTA